MQKAIKQLTGECSFVTEQEFSSVDDAVKDVNPLTEAKAQVSNLTIHNTKYKLKNEDLHKANTEAFGKTKTDSNDVNALFYTEK